MTLSANQIKKYSINLLWINKSKSEDKFFKVFNGEHAATDTNESLTAMLHEKDSSLGFSTFAWAKANPEAIINVWYDSSLTLDSSVAAIKAKIAEQPNIKLRDTRDIPIVKSNQDLFDEHIPIYLRVDLLKKIILVHCVESEKHDSAIVTDAAVGDRRFPDKATRRMTKEELFDDATMKTLGLKGFMCNHNGFPENQFLQLVHNDLMIQALKDITINLTMKRMVNFLNYNRENPDKLRRISSGLVFDAMRLELEPYFYYLKGKVDLLIKEQPGSNEPNNGALITYEPQKHGLDIFPSSPKDLDKYDRGFERDKYADYYQDGKPYSIRSYSASRRVDVRLGNDHGRCILNAKTQAIPSTYTPWASVPRGPKAQVIPLKDELFNKHNITDQPISTTTDSFIKMLSEQQRINSKAHADCVNTLKALAVTSLNNFNKVIENQYANGSEERSCARRFVQETSKLIQSRHYEPTMRHEEITRDLKMVMLNHAQTSFSRTPSLLDLLKDILMIVFAPIGLVVASQNRANSGYSFFYINRADTTKLQTTATEHIQQFNL